MRYAIVADIHGNLAAFQSVLADIEKKGGADEFWCLGDVVGYGPEPHLCLELSRNLKFTSLAGNHDWCAIGKLNPDRYPHDIAFADRWAGTCLNGEERVYLANLPLKVCKEKFTLVHGSPKEPLEKWLLDPAVAREQFSYFETSCCLIGHSHIPLYFELKSGECIRGELLEGKPLELGETRLMINPGAVGQPRNGDPRASYAVYDSEAETVTRYCVKYDVEATCARMIEVGLPPALTTRLIDGVFKRSA